MRGGFAVVESRRGEVQSGRQPSGRLGLLEGGVSLIEEELLSEGLVVVDGLGLVAAEH
jgi:hypothetical protein